MTFAEYQSKARETAVYPSIGHNYVYPVLGLVGEAGEVAEKVKKVIRDSGGVIDDSARQQIHSELGDVLWYVSTLCSELSLDLQSVAENNLEKLAKRKREGKLHGSGDFR